MLQQVQVFADVGSQPMQRRERRPVTLTAFANRADGSASEITIVDLSFSGCGVICTTSLVAGERLSLSVLGRGTAEAIVRWVDGARAGLSFESTDVSESASKKPRRHERVSVEGEVTMRRSGKTSFRVHIYDLSPDGCKAEFVERPELDEQLWIKFDGLEALEARVRWLSGAKAGLSFIRPLHPAVFDLIVSRLGSGQPQSSAA
jgi:hypothetical protein